MNVEECHHACGLSSSASSAITTVDAMVLLYSVAMAAAMTTASGLFSFFYSAVVTASD